MTSLTRGKRRGVGPAVVFSCEHGGNRIPAAYRSLFAGADDVLATHRGWDIGALAVARSLAGRFGAPLHFATVSRLLCDLNRSPGHGRLHSEWTRHLSPPELAVLIARHYRPYRQEVEDRVARLVTAKRPVLHLSVHSFTPELGGHVRNCEIGLLYDPRRPNEARGADALHAALRATGTTFRVRRNYPYTGVSDGFQSYLRRRFPTRLYTAIELEMNQAVVSTQAGRSSMARVLRTAVAQAFDLRTV